MRARCEGNRYADTRVLVMEGPRKVRTDRVESRQKYCCRKRDPAAPDLFLAQADLESRQIAGGLPQAVAVT